jgi:tetratricopeptide (TPR) repeat protein
VLFDLQSPGRRRIIKVVYSLLAILLLVGLVGFGIGSSVSGGGLSDLFGGGGSADAGFDSQISDAQDKLDANPKNAKAQLELVTLYLQSGNAQLDADQSTGQTIVTSDSEDSFNKAADAWDAYLKLKPKQPDTGAALQIAGTFFLLAQNSTTAADARAQVKAAADAQQVAVDANPSRGNLGNLALYLYFAGEFDKANQVSAEAIAKAPPGQQAQLKKQLDQFQQQGEAFEKQVKQEAKQGAQSGANPLDNTGGALGGGSLGSP